MDDLLAVRVTKKTADGPPPRPLIAEIFQPAALDSPREILDVLRREPDLHTVHRCLERLSRTPDDGESFDLRFPSPLAAQITHSLVSNIIPHYWAQLREDTSSKSTKKLLKKALRNVSGIGAILAQLKSFNTERNAGEKPGNPKEQTDEGSDLVQVLEYIFDGDLVNDICHDVSIDAPKPKQTLLWRGFVQLIASSRIISTIAEAEGIMAQSYTNLRRSWLSSGSEYSRWLSRSTAKMAQTLILGSEQEAMWEAAAQILGNALSLGYTEIIVEQLISDLLLRTKAIERLKRLINDLKTHEQPKFLICLMSVLSRRLSKLEGSAFDLQSLKSTPKSIAGSVAVVKELISGNKILGSVLTDMATGDLGAAIINSPALLRAVLAVLSDDQDILETVMEKSLNRFGDNLYIKHAPILQQEATAQVLLISSGYLHRKQPMFVFTVVRSSTHTKGISNRIAAPSERARWLGMVVGMALSGLIDKPENRMVFDNDEVRTEQANWYLELTHVDDKPGSLQDFRNTFASSIGPTTKSALTIKKNSIRKVDANAVPKPKPKAHGKRVTTSSGLKIVELDDEEKEDDLIPYAKPDSDPSDSEEDPTIIQRSKPRPPVYIRDLLSGLKETEDYDRLYLALSNAASLIRRKANFGKEVADHAEELATTLLNLNDPFDIEDFEDLRQRATIAVLIAKPTDIARYLAVSFFSGDYSIQQRTAILTALGLGARELAGFKDSQATEPPSPSKALPPHLHGLYASSRDNPLNRAAASLEHTTLEPLALEAADSLTGPNALKVRTFSSRLDPKKQESRTKKVSNKLATIVAESFFFPLVGRFQALYQSYGGGSNSVYLSPYLLPTFLRTLGVIINAAGPGTLALPIMTSELWDLLLSQRAAALVEKEVGVLEALLFAMLMMLEVNEDKERLAREHARELVETSEWSRLVLERMEGGGSEGERVRMLAAGVVVRVGEVLERWRRVMVGGLVDV